MGSYKLTGHARADLIRIHQWGVRTHGVAQADKYAKQLVDRFQQIADNPLLYPATDNFREGYRRSVVGSDSIYYQIRGNAVEITAILGRQDLNAWL